MKAKAGIDLYTKIVLTAIALCLLWICLGDTKLVAPLRAAAPEMVDVRIRAIERLPGLPWDVVATTIGNGEPVPVAVQNDVLTVDVRNVAVKQSLKPLDKDK